MEILVTGTPGAGKTLFTITELAKEFADRPVWYCGITNLKLPWIEVDREKVKTWHEWLPARGVLVVDEAQLSFPLRPSTQRPPEYVEKLTTHRHLGVDIVLITQHPSNMDGYVRKLVGRHIHIHRPRGFGSVRIREWDNYDDGYMTKSRVQMADARTWKYPKDAFQLYHSAEVHTVKARVPRVFYVLVGCLVLTAIGAVATYRHFNAYGDAQREAQKQLAKPLKDATAAAKRGSDGEPIAGADETDPAGFRKVSTARDDAKPVWERKQFAKLVEAKRAPTPEGCIQRADDAQGVSCRCYTEDGTMIPDVPIDYCQKYVGGSVFAYWRVARQGVKAISEGVGDLAAAAATSAALPRKAAAAPHADASNSQDNYTPMTIAPGAPVTGHRSADWAVLPRYQ